MKNFNLFIVFVILFGNNVFGNPPQGTNRVSVRNNTTTYYGKRGFLGQSTTRNGRTNFYDTRGGYGFQKNINGQQRFYPTRSK